MGFGLNIPIIGSVFGIALLMVTAWIYRDWIREGVNDIANRFGSATQHRIASSSQLNLVSPKAQDVIFEPRRIENHLMQPFLGIAPPNTINDTDLPDL